MNYRDVQNVAKQTIEYIKENMKPGMHLIEVRRICEKKMLELGADSFWYWDIGAFCFLGEDTTVSVSGTQYKTSDKKIQKNDIITIDLSPQYKNIWGDYARTIIFEEGKVIQSIDEIKNVEWKNGLVMEEILHKEMGRFSNVNTTFEELYFHMNEYIIHNGYRNLDFAGNLGHSIVKAKSDRIYIEKGNKVKLSDVELFTFEPHISSEGSKYGHKKEDIYYFNNKILEIL